MEAQQRISNDFGIRDESIILIKVEGCSKEYSSVLIKEYAQEGAGGSTEDFH